MREIKFRAWDTKDKVIRDVVGISLYHEALSVDIEFGKYLQDDIKRFELMQYTGLKDVNGVDIYEGDIVEVNYIGPSEIKIITYHNASYGIRDREIGYVPLAIFERPRNNVTILGNIYENPELLERK